MTSIIKVDQIQNAAGGVPTAADLGLNVSGSIVNVAQVDLGVGQTVSSTSFVQITNASLTVTPKSASNTILIEGVSHQYFNNSQSAYWKAGPLAIYRDATKIADDNANGGEYGVAILSGTIVMIKSILSVIDAPNTTGPITYTLHTRNVNSNNPSFVANGYGIGYLRVMEIAG